ncbi:hypothetical protein NW754_014750 [Fusarium falciforme]|nr:hypothetical protein NW754_014750 [Fusarium falciforme]
MLHLDRLSTAAYLYPIILNPILIPAQEKETTTPLDLDSTLFASMQSAQPAGASCEARVIVGRARFGVARSAHRYPCATPRTRRRRSPSPNPAHNATQTLPLRRSDDNAHRGHAQQHSPAMSSRKPIVAQPNMPGQPSPRHAPDDSTVKPADSKNEDAPSPFPKLLQDVSQYTNPHLAPENESTTLEELAHLVRLSKYQERKRANTRLRLQRNLVSTALSARLTRCGEIAHRNLVDSFRRDDKENFSALYNAIHDVRNSCDELRRYALLDPEMEGLASAGIGSSESLDTPTNSAAALGPLKTITPFLHDISASARDTFMDFLTQLRTNPDYLATRICSLSSSELNSFLTYHKGLEPVESVLPFHGRSAGRSHASASGRSSTAVDIERLLSFQRHDPLSILIHTCFANSAGPDSSEDQRRTEIWSTALARLISEPKSTGEHFLISVLNIWTAMRDWSGKSNMEWYLMKILEDGAFLWIEPRISMAHDSTSRTGTTRTRSLPRSFTRGQ